MNGRKPEPVGDILKGVLRQAGLEKRLKGGNPWADAWVSAAGDRTAAHTRVLGLRRNLLEVEVDSSAMLAELAGFRKAELLRELREKRKDITDIRFKIGVFHGPGTNG
ncbi:MAG: DUF721 domain-containing protein [Planctomycetota bacterium]